MCIRTRNVNVNLKCMTEAKRVSKLSYKSDSGIPKNYKLLKCLGDLSDVWPNSYMDGAFPKHLEEEELLLTETAKVRVIDSRNPLSLPQLR